MKIFEQLYNSPEINMIIDNINEVYNKSDENILVACHGRYHTMFVIDTAEYILQSLSYDSKIVELGKIAALLHDIGSIAGRRNHARKSAALSEVFLDDLEHLLPEEKDMIIQAIADHSDGSNISGAIGAALLIADKANISKRRILPVENIDAWSKNLLAVEDVDIHISGKTIVINCITTDTFSKELMLSEYKGFHKMMKAAEYLGCDCHIQFNGVEEIID